MKQAGFECRVLNIQPRAPESEAYIKISGPVGLLKELLRHVANGWALSVHTNGHNPKSWFIALACGIAAQFGPGGTLTLHSGMVPGYLGGGRQWTRTVARMACVFYERVVCVNPEIATAIASLGVPSRQLEVKPAFLPLERSPARIPDELEAWSAGRSPLISVTLAFRPEYGFELLVRAVAVLRLRYPGLGCVVMGGGENRADAEGFLERQGMAEAIYLVGDLDHKACLAVISRSAVFVRPTYADGDSISVREAMSLGVPVVASKVGMRPAGALLFDAGDLDGLVAQVVKILSQDRTKL